MSDFFPHPLTPAPSLNRGTLLSTAQIAALANLAELHPGEPIRLDSLASAGQQGPVALTVEEATYVAHVDGRLICEHGATIGPVIA